MNKKYIEDRITELEGEIDSLKTRAHYHRETLTRHSENFNNLRKRIEQLEQSSQKTIIGFDLGTDSESETVFVRGVYDKKTGVIEIKETWKGKPEQPNPVKIDKSDLKWCDTCRYGDILNTCDRSSHDRNTELIGWQIENCPRSSPKLHRTIDDVKESCPCYEPRVKKNCDSCGNDYIDGDGDRLCKVMVNKAFDCNGVYNWIREHYCSRCEQCKQGADNCPGWKPKE